MIKRTCWGHSTQTRTKMKQKREKRRQRGFKLSITHPGSDGNTISISRKPKWTCLGTMTFSRWMFSAFKLEENPLPGWIGLNSGSDYNRTVFVLLQHRLFGNSPFFINGKVVILWIVQSFFNTLIQVLQGDEVLCFLLEEIEGAKSQFVRSVFRKITRISIVTFT